MIWLMALTIGTAADAPSPPTLIYYNARMALRERRPTEALKLWFLRNALESKTGELSEHDEDFRSITWVALSELGLCQDGIRPDEVGVGLWPLALHNWFLKNMRRGEAADQPAPFGAFQIPQQQRFVSLHDVLSLEEFESVRFYRTDCYRMRDLLVSAGVSRSGDPNERKVQVRVLTFLLRAALQTLVKERVKGTSTIEARLLDLQLKDMELLDRSSQRDYRTQRRQIKELGGAVSPPVDVALSKSVLKMLSVTTTWDADDWLALEPARRLYLYDWVRRAGDSGPRKREVELSIVDRFIERQDGSELSAWIAFGGTTAEAKAEIWSGERGLRLLGLEKKTGFRERSAIALHRGVDAVGAGALPDALRSLAFALHFADESTQSETIRRLSLRWLSFVANQFEVTDELLTMLVTLVPRGDLAQILEDLAWEAALSADASSFDRTVRAHRGRGALGRRMERLRPLAEGDAGRFLTALRDEMVESPHATLRFVRRFLERIETLDGDVRANHRGTLRKLRDLLIANGASAGVKGSLGRTADELEGRCVAILEGLPESESMDTARDRAGALSPVKEVFAGSIRMAPSDALPWPFPLPEVRAPSVFQPLPITPVEWPSSDGLVMGWKLGH